MQTSDAIALTSSIAGALAAIAALFTIFEMRKQRRATYRPHLAFESPTFKVKWQFKDESLAWETREAVLGASSIAKSIAFIRVFNVGAGAATDVKVNFSFDIHEFVRIIEGINDKRWQIDLDDQRLAISTGGRLGMIIPFQNSLTVELPYVLPSSSNPTGFNLQLPASYSELVKLFFGKYAVAEDFHGDFEPIPKLRATFTYRDIEYSSMSLRLTIQPEILFASARKTLDEDMEIALCVFDLVTDDS